MKKSSQIEYVQRINLARSKFRLGDSVQDVTKALGKHFNISYRQAYRYVKKAMESEEEQIIPEEKIVFTVKLPKGLVMAFRNYAKLHGQQISYLMHQILEDYLNSTGKDAKEKIK